MTDDEWGLMQQGDRAPQPVTTKPKRNGVKVALWLGAFVTVAFLVIQAFS